MTDNERGLCAATAAWLHAGRALAAWGLALSVLALAGCAALARGRIGHLGALDAGLAALGLRADDGETRPLDARLAGALQLLRWHRSAVVLQCVLWLVAVGCLR
jgi:hypothetical protein